MINNIVSKFLLSWYSYSAYSKGNDVNWHFL